MTLVVYHPSHGTGTSEKLSLLASLSASLPVDGRHADPPAVS